MALTVTSVPFSEATVISAAGDTVVVASPIDDQITLHVFGRTGKRTLSLVGREVLTRIDLHDAEKRERAAAGMASVVISERYRIARRRRFRPLFDHAIRLAGEVWLRRVPRPGDSATVYHVVDLGPASVGRVAIAGRATVVGGDAGRVLLVSLDGLDKMRVGVGYVQRPQRTPPR